MEALKDFWDIVADGRLVDVFGLMSQQEMVLWAERMFWVTLGSTGITFVGSIALILTLLQTSKATRAALSSVELTREGISISQKIGEAQTRAYLSIENAQVTIRRSTNTAVRNFPVIQLTVMNYGNSPAKAFQWEAEFVYNYRGSIRKLLGSDQGFPSEGWGKNIKSQGTLFEEINFLTAGMDNDIQAAFAEQGVHLTVTIHLRYNDVFDRQQKDSFNFSASITKSSRHWHMLEHSPHSAKFDAALGELNSNGKAPRGEAPLP